MPKWAKVFLLAFLGVLLLASVGFVLWASNPLPPMPEALAALKSNTQVEVIAEEGWLTFLPRAASSDIGLILYPGGRVDFRAYAPLARSIAAQGYPVFLVKMPLNLAVFNPNAAEAVMASYSQIGRWAVGGHSLGGAMAANFAKKHPQPVVGLVLWASYPASSDDLSQTGLAVLSVFADRDALATLDKIQASRSLLPSDTQWVRIEGGNHAQFGWYGDQPGDGVASISRQAQQEQILLATVQFLESLKTR
ncbi:MAG: alpha/beta hydrolase [Anaerolineales bacterium]|nr:alpha/beta hydrolase [Anaerolineales bacterium]